MKLKELLQIAKTELADLTTLSTPDFRLEQAVKTESGWEIVVSYLVANTNKPSKPFAALAPEFEFHRMYKRVNIDAEGEVVGLFIYNSRE